MNLYKIYHVEVGVLLDKDDPEFNSYNMVWDHKNGYYNEDNCFYINYEKANEYLKYYISNGGANTYGIIAAVYVNKDVYECVAKENEVDLGDKIFYEAKSVIYSEYKDNNNQIVKYFIDTAYEHKTDRNENEEIESL